MSGAKGPVRKVPQHFLDSLMWKNFENKSEPNQPRTK